VTSDAGQLASRLRRLETQIAAFRDLHTKELGEAADRLAAIAKLQDDELQMILDELADISSAAETAAMTPDADAPVGDAATASDPAAASPRRARWLAEQERRSHVTRRDLFRPRSE